MYGERLLNTEETLDSMLSALRGLQDDRPLFDGRMIDGELAVALITPVMSRAHSLKKVHIRLMM